MQQRTGWVVMTVLIATLTATSGASFARAAQPNIPTVLEPWRGWVLDRHPDVQCPPRYDNASIRSCVWMSALKLDLTQAGGHFSIEVEVFANADVILPGDADEWPGDVTSNGAPAIVTRLKDLPRLRLPSGRYAIAGALHWNTLPDSLAVPRQPGALQLSIGGRAVAQPLIKNGRLWLGASPATSGATAELPNDSLTARVYRRLDDGVPMLLQTYIDLSVAGSHRLVTLGRALPDGFELTAIDSRLPAHLDDSGQLEVQVEPGEWQVQVTGRALDAPTAFRVAPKTENWPEQEIWGFNADRTLRVVNVEGATPIDLSQTNAPFKDIPAYVVSAQNELKLVEQFRGDPNPTPNDFSLSRDIWLSFNGRGVTVRDTLDGSIARPTRLAARFVPGRMTVDGAPQLITRLGDTKPGIELLSGKHRIVATSELSRGSLDTAVGWDTDVSRLSGELHLPPGWRLLWTHGVDRAPTAWLSMWTLWDIFLVVISVVLALRVLGRPAAVLFGLTLALVFQEPGAPTFVWIVLLVLLAVLQVARARLGQLARLGYFVVLAVTVLGVLSFAIDSFRMAIYPQLENPSAALPRSVAGEFGMTAPAEDRAAASEANSVRTRVVSSLKRQNAPEVALAAAPVPRFESNTQVQTGPGVPTWQWRDETLIWDGPVTAAQSVALVFSPPWLTRSLHVVGPVLLLLLAAIVGGATLPPSIPLPTWLKRFSMPAVGALLFVASLALPPPARADIPSPDMLDELEQRLTQPPDCLPACAAVEHARVTLAGDQLTVRLDINAAATVALPLPSAARWWPLEARDGDQAAIVTRDDAGQLAIALTAGVHAIELSGPVTDIDRFELSFPTPPGRISLDLKGWHAYGVQDGRLRGGALQFERETVSATKDAKASLAPAPIAPYFRLSRTFDFGLEWRIHTTLTRLAPSDGGIPFAVPLVPGESLLDGRVRVENGKIIGVLAPGQRQIDWRSALASTDTLQLTAPAVSKWSEQWTLIPSNFWHVDYVGVPVTLTPMKLAAGESPGPRFAPLGGERLTITLTKPIPVPGETITVESIDLSEQPGARARRSTLALRLLSSQGGNYAVHIPGNAKILSIAINGAPQPIPTAGESLPLPVVPGSETAEVVWEAPLSIGAMLRTSAVELPGHAYNVRLNLSLPTDRWPLFVGGPLLGPAILYWGVVVVVIGIAWLLARIPALPLTTLDGVLLGFGMSLCNLPSTVLVAAWLLLLLLRRRYADRLQSSPVRAFQLTQILLALGSIVALIALAASVPMGLLGTPEMHIVGYGSSAYSYHWFQDQTRSTLPTAYVMSAPIWLYRVVMLAWSLWLAFAIMRWVRWGWTAFTAGATWRSTRANAEPAPSAG